MFKYIWNYIWDVIRMSWNAPRTASGGLDMRFNSNKELAKKKSGCGCIIGIIVFIIILFRIVDNNIRRVSENEKVLKETSDSTRVEHQKRKREKSTKESIVSFDEEEPTLDTAEIAEPITNLEGESNFNVDFVEGNKEIIPAEKEFVEVALPCDAE